MPKQKTHSGTKDRVRITKNGKVMMRKSHRNHFLEKKSSSRKRTYSGFNQIKGGLKARIKRNLGVK